MQIETLFLIETFLGVVYENEIYCNFVNSRLGIWYCF